MEIRKIVYVIIVGALVCVIFAGVLKDREEAGISKGNTKETVLQDMVQTSSLPEVVPTKEPVIQNTQEPERTTAIPAEVVVETSKPTEVTTMEPVAEIPHKQEKTPVPQNTPQPIQPTEMPHKTQAPVTQNPATPMPVYTQTPVPTTSLPTEEEVHEHEFEKSIWELPTCQKGGYYNNVCKICGLVECVSQEPLPHEQEDIVLQEGNCMEDKVIRHICKECGVQVQSDTRYTMYDEHQWGTDEVDGKLVEYCERCGVVK